MQKTAGRIKYLDLLRVFAIFMMVQGHTVDTFLVEKFRSYDYFFYDLWVTLRGYTAPLFFFTSGVILTYLLSNDCSSERKFFRIKKGYLRALQLILIGYLLRFPSHKIIDFSQVTLEGWKIFFTVDALHLIACGIFLIFTLSVGLDKLKVNPKLFFLVLTILVAMFSETVNQINWIEILPYPLAGYFYFETGSYFPLFPYLTYILFGAFIGTSIQKGNPGEFNPVHLICGIFLSLFLIIPGFYETGKILHITGVLLILFELFKGLSKFRFLNFKKIILISDKSLLIYVVHLVILYGCAWFPGFYKIAGQEFSVEITLLFVILMLILMYSLVIFTDRIFKKKQNPDLR